MPPPRTRAAVVARPTPPKATPGVRRVRNRRLYDCVFLPDIEVVQAFVAARQRIDDLDERRRRVFFDREGPLVVGVLLTLIPPIGVTFLWASRRFSNVAKVAVSCYGALVTAILALLLARLL
jgi:hypothetical protein